MYLAHLNWQEAEQVLSNPDTIVVIPVGSTEQHGCIGPLGTDWMVPEEFCRRLNKALPDLLIVPVLPYGVATHHINFPGTIDLGLEVMCEVMQKILESLYKHGARRFVVMNGHGGNDLAIEKAALEMYRKGSQVTLINWWSIAPHLNKDWPTGHGDAQEVSAVLAFAPECVHPAKWMESEIYSPSERLKQVKINTVQFEGAPVKLIREIRDSVNTGGIGGLTAEHACKAWGEAMMDGLTDWMIRYIEEFGKLGLPQARKNP